jgi:hypothetical protein
METLKVDENRYQSAVSNSHCYRHGIGSLATSQTRSNTNNAKQPMPLSSETFMRLRRTYAPD